MAYQRAKETAARCDYSLRTFLLCITVICLWLGWKVHQARQQQRIVAAVRDLGGNVGYDFERGPDLLPYNPPLEPGWLSDFLGVDYVHDVTGIGILTRHNFGDLDNLLPCLCDLPRLRGLGIPQCTIRDNDLRYLASLKDLEKLNLMRNQISGEGFVYLANLQKLNRLWLDDNPITDQGLETIPKMPNLLRIDLDQTNITDACIDTLANRLPGLKLIDVRDTYVTADGVGRLVQLKPGLKIVGTLNQVPRPKQSPPQ